MSSTAALLLFGTGFFQVAFMIKSQQVEPGQSAFIWCSHNVHVPGDLYWFKQTCGGVPVTIVRMSLTQNPQKEKADLKYLNIFTKERFLSYPFNKSSNLIIDNVSISDSGLYFCGSIGDQIKFGNGTMLDVKENNVKLEKEDTRTLEKDDEQPVSTEAYSRDIFYILTLLFGGIIFLMCVITLIWAIIREHKRQNYKKVAEFRAQQHYKGNDSAEYAALHFSKSPKNAGQYTEYTIAVYTYSS